jgi:hypothetical protein
MSWDNSGLLVVSRGIACQFEDLGSQVFKNCSQVDWSAGTNPLSVVTLTEQTMDTTNWELKSSTG